MYLDHFGFDCEPFSITPDARFLFSSSRHREAMASLLYGIEQRKGFIALTGEIGSGKTTICRALLQSLSRDSIRLALILNPQLNDVELLQAINDEFGLPHTSTSRRELLSILNKYLLAQYSAGRNCVLVIDESQLLKPEALEQVRLISNLELDHTKLIQIALVGQPELDDILHLPELEQLNQRIMVRFHINPLNQEETGEYVLHRVAIAHPKRPPVFGTKAIRAIYRETDGVPRRINVLLDRALLAAFGKNTYEITEAIVTQAAREVKGERRHKPAAATTAGDAPRWPLVAAIGIGAVALGVFMMKDLRETPATPDEQSTPAMALREVAFVGVDSEVAEPAIEEAPVVAEETEEEEVAEEPVIELEPELVPEPEPEPVAPAPTPTPTPTPAPTIVEAPPNWTWDAQGVLRVAEPELTYTASVLTWLSLARGETLEEAGLAALRTMTPEEVIARNPAVGRPPLFLRHAQLPTVLELLRPRFLPALVQFDEDSPTPAPWGLLLQIDGDSVVVADPIAGRVTLDRDDVEQHLASIVVPYSDPTAITGLTSSDSGERVLALQRLLTRAQVYSATPNGQWDDATARALTEYRRRVGLPGPGMVDETIALHLIREVTE